MAMKLKLDGFRDVEKALAELPKATGKNVLRRVGKRALEPMRAKAESLAPVADAPYVRGSYEKGTLRTVLPGGLKRSVTISEKRTRRVKKERGPKRGIEMAMGPGSGTGVLNYAAFDEFGTDDTAPQPFMRPAWDAEADPALETIKSDLWSEIDKSAKRRARKRAKG